MIFIIDANNLAGKLELLDEDNFDQKLICQIKDYFYNKNNEVILIFDSLDMMGNKIVQDNLTIIYTPRDNYYKDADDKVLEIVANFLRKDSLKEEITVISDDIELSENILKEIKDSENEGKVKIVKSTIFAEKMFLVDNKEEVVEKEELLQEDVDDLKKELLEKWKE